MGVEPRASQVRARAQLWQGSQAPSFFYFLFWDWVLINCPGYPWTCSVIQASSIAGITGLSHCSCFLLLYGEGSHCKSLKVTAEGLRWSSWKWPLQKCEREGMRLDTLLLLCGPRGERPESPGGDLGCVPIGVGVLVSFGIISRTLESGKIVIVEMWYEPQVRDLYIYLMFSGTCL